MGKNFVPLSYLIEKGYEKSGKMPSQILWRYMYIHYCLDIGVLYITVSTQLKKKKIDNSMKRIQ